MILGVAGFTALLVGAVLAYNALSKQVQPGVDAGRTQAQGEQRPPAPGFTVTDGDGNPVRLSDLRGRPVVLNFWATWCPYCVDEMPAFDRVHGELGGGVQFMMVNLQESVETGMQYVRGKGYGFPVYFDAQGDAAAAYGVRGIPATFFIDAEGNLASSRAGALDEAALRRGIDSIQ